MSSYIPVISRELDVSQYKGVSGAKSRRISVAPDNISTYTSSTSTQDIFFSIPASRNSWICSNATQIVFEVLANSVHVTDPVVSLANGSGSSIFQALEVICQNQSIETVTNLPVYAAMIEDLQSTGRANGLGSIVHGRSTLKVGTAINSSTTATDGNPIRCSVPLYSALLGAGAEQYAYMGIDGWRVRLTLANSFVALALGNVTSVTSYSYKLSNISLQFEVMDLDSMTMSALIQESGGVFKQHGCAVNNYQSTIVAATANSILIPARFSSVKAILVAFRPSATLVAANSTQNQPGGRIMPQIQQYFFTIDGANVPSVPVRVATSDTKVYGGETMSEIMKIFGGSNSALFDCVFSSTTFHDVAGTGGAGKTGSFFLGVNFETQDSSGSALVVGRDLNSSNTILNLSHYTTAVASVSDAFALYDIVLSYDMATGSVTLSK